MCGLAAREPRRPHRRSLPAKPVRPSPTKAAKSHVTPALTVSRQPVLLVGKPGGSANQHRTALRGLHMDEQALRGLIAEVKTGKLSRRAFINQMIAVGLTAPLATQMLVYSGAAHAQAKPTAYTPTKRGGGGPLKMLWWQGATLLNPHFAVGTKDQDGCRIFYEPLASWDPDGQLYPVLAAEIPDLENGGLAKDGM